MIYLFLTWVASPILWLRAGLMRRRRYNRILLIQTAKIGDFVSTTPVFRAVRTRFPSMEIVALLHPVNEPLAKGLDSIDRVVTLPEHGFKGWAGKRWLLGVCAEGYDAVVILSPNLTNMLVPFWAGVCERISVLPDRRQGSARLARPFLTHGEIHRSGRLFRETALRALGGLGLAFDSTLSALPNEIRVTESGVRRVNALALTDSRPLVGLGIGAGNRMKALEISQLQQLAEGILSRSAATLVLVGTDVDRQTAAALTAGLAAGRVVDATGQWPLADLPALLKALDCFVGVDSGATYVADAAGVPVVDMMGPADADDQRPLGVGAVVLRSAVPCAPCSHAFDAPYCCRMGDRRCLTRMLHEPVIEAVVRIVTTVSVGEERRK